ncbi:MAG: hypothetical protein MI892_17130 [Desulfobacterales bacterium]|nr:hypothetical protein [Desulfobacterales bacterium]
MKFTIIHEPTESRFIIRTTGNFDIDDFFLSLRALLSHPDWVAGSNIIVDHRATSLDELYVHDLRGVVDKISVINDLLGYSRCAIVVKLEGFSKAAMYKFIADSKLQLTTEIFDSSMYDAAISWLEN